MSHTRTRIAIIADNDDHEYKYINASRNLHNRATTLLQSALIGKPLNKTCVLHLVSYMLFFVRLCSLIFRCIVKKWTFSLMNNSLQLCSLLIHVCVLICLILYRLCSFYFSTRHSFFLFVITLSRVYVVILR